jgi:hypothetical protein
LDNEVVAPLQRGQEEMSSDPQTVAPPPPVHYKVLNCQSRVVTQREVCYCPHPRSRALDQRFGPRVWGGGCKITPNIILNLFSKALTSIEIDHGEVQP